MRKTLSIFLLACFIISMSGGWLLFGIYRQEAKMAMANFIQLNKDHLNLVQLKITAANVASFDIQDGGNEVSYNNIWYDVVLREQTKGSTILRCVQDENETNLIEAFNKSIQQQHQQSPASKSLLRYLLSNQIYAVPWSITVLEQPIALLSCQRPVFKSLPFYNLAVKVVTPPPQKAA